MRCAILTMLLMFPLSGAAALAAAEPRAVSISEDGENTLEKSIIEAAAEYRIERAEHIFTAKEDAAVADYLKQIKAIIATGEVQSGESWLNATGIWGREERAFDLAGNAISRLSLARRVGDLYLARITYAVQSNNLAAAHNALLELWHRLSDYDRTDEAMELAMRGIESAMQFQSIVDLNATTPRDVIVELSGNSNKQTYIPLCRFLIDHGDRETIRPRAHLALARSYLLQDERDARIVARQTYEDILAAYPDQPLAFDVLCELAITEISTYRGADYDAGALIKAVQHIDRAELLTKGDPKRLAVIESYRRRLRGWQQQRDLAIARWYRDRHEPAALAFLTMPSGLSDWRAGAVYYYREAIRRDPASAEARIARNELAALPPAAAAPATQTPTTPTTAAPAAR